MESERWGRAFLGRGGAGVTAQAWGEEQVGLSGEQRGPRHPELTAQMQSGRTCLVYTRVSQGSADLIEKFFFFFPCLFVV